VATRGAPAGWNRNPRRHVFQALRRSGDAAQSTVLLPRSGRPTEPVGAPARVRPLASRSLSSLGSAIRDTREAIAKLCGENEVLRMQLAISKKRNVSVQLDSTVDIDQMDSEIAAIGDVCTALRDLEGRAQAQEKSLCALGRRLTGLQRTSAERSAQLEQLTRERDDVTEECDWLAAASRSEKATITSLNETIKEAEKRHGLVDGRIEDLKNIIDVKQREVFTKTRVPKPDVIRRCAKLRVRRGLDRENMRLLAMAEMEKTLAENAAARTQEECDEGRLEWMRSQNRMLRDTCLALKRRFCGARAGDRKVATLTSETELELMRARIMDRSTTLASEKKGSRTLSARIDKQMRILGDYRIEVPPPPGCFRGMVPVQDTQQLEEDA